MKTFGSNTGTLFYSSANIRPKGTTIRKGDFNENNGGKWCMTKSTAAFVTSMVILLIGWIIIKKLLIGA